MQERMLSSKSRHTSEKFRHRLQTLSRFEALSQVETLSRVEGLNQLGEALSQFTGALVRGQRSLVELVHQCLPGGSCTPRRPCSTWRRRTRS